MDLGMDPHPPEGRRRPVSFSVGFSAVTGASRRASSSPRTIIKKSESKEMRKVGRETSATRGQEREHAKKREPKLSQQEELTNGIRPALKLVLIVILYTSSMIQRTFASLPKGMNEPAGYRSPAGQKEIFPDEEQEKILKLPII